MITVKNTVLVLLATIASHSCLVARYNPFKDMQDHFERMAQEFDEHFSHMKGQSEDAMQLSIDDNTQNKQVMLTVTNLETEMVDTEVNRAGNKLTLKIDGGSIVLHVKNNYVSVSMEYMQKNEEKDEKGKKQSMGSSYFSSSFGQTVSHRLDLKNPSVEYTKDTKTLIISIPYAQTEEEGSTKIPVNIK